MNVLSALIKCALVGFFAGFLTSTGPQLGNGILSLAGLMAFIGFTFVLFELTSLGSPSGGSLRHRVVAGR